MPAAPACNSATEKGETRMTGTHLDAPLFIEELHQATVDIGRTPFFFNDHGTPAYLSAPPPGVAPLPPAAVDPALVLGNAYTVAQVLGVKPTLPYGIQTQLGFAADRVEFAPLWATREAAAAFGITLVEPGQAIRIDSPVAELQQVEYRYGVFAGHWSPYQETGNTLLSAVCTDLEHHDFPHIFASTDAAQPLVISVGRYWPERGTIRLANLWGPRGSALYVPPMPAYAGQPCIDLHNNRNSAGACWGDIRQNSITTHTLLQTDGGFFHWYWNAMATAHGRPLAIR